MTKPILITPANASKIEAVLNAANGRATSHTYSVYSEIEEIAQRAERLLLETVGLKKLAPGAKFHSTSGNSVPNSYQYMRAATSVVIERRGAGWYFCSAKATKIFACGGAQRLVISQENYQAGARHLLQVKHISIETPAQAAA